MIRPHSDSWLLRIASYALPALSTATVTLGKHIYTPTGAPPSEATFAHEMVHVGQWKRYGHVLFALMYACWPLPIGFAWGRWRLEREAYLVEIVSYGRSVESCVDALDSSLYWWPWPRLWMARWFMMRLKEGV